MTLDGDITNMQDWLSGKTQAAELIHRDGTQYNFELASSDVHSTGLVLLTYTPRKAA
jgi:hypothetical protein